MIIEAVQPALTEEEFRVYCKGPDKRPRDVVLDAPLRMIAKATGWQGLTDDDVHELTKEVIAFKSDVVKFIREAEAKLREKNT